MGGAVSVSVKNDLCFQRIAAVAQCENKTDALFDNIAGRCFEKIKHLNMSKKCYICLDDVVAYFSNAKDPLFQNFMTNPVVIVNVAYYYCFGLYGEDIDNRNEEELKMNRERFQLFLPSLLLFSRLWEVFKNVGRSPSGSPLKDKYFQPKSLGFSQLDTASGEEIHLGRENNQNIFISFYIFAEYCTKNVITPENYFASGVNAMATEDTTEANEEFPQYALPLSVDVDANADSDSASMLQSLGHQLSKRSPLNRPHMCEDIGMSLYSPINSVSSIVIRSNNTGPAHDAGVEECVSIDSVSRRSDLHCLAVSPPTPKQFPNKSTEILSALHMLYGRSLSNNNKSSQSFSRLPFRNQNNCPLSTSSICQTVDKEVIVHNKNVGDKHAPRPPVGWRELNKRREILFRPEVSSPRAVFVTDNAMLSSSTPRAAMVQSLKAPLRESTPHRPASAAAKLSWRRNKPRGESAALWTPRHAVSTKKKKFSAVRTLQM